MGNEMQLSEGNRALREGSQIRLKLKSLNLFKLHNTSNRTALGHNSSLEGVELLSLIDTV